MNQTTWIVGGGIAVVVVATLLYFYTGDGIPKVSPIDPLSVTSQAVTSPDTLNSIDESTTTPAIVAEEVNNTSNMPPENDTNNTQTASFATLHTSMGDITVKFASVDAPKTVENFIKLASSGFYDGVKFHRVIKGFMNQTGDPQSKDDALMNRWGTGGPGYQFDDEIDSGSTLYQRGYKHGVLAMANSGANTNGSQFFIMAADYPLPPLYTIFGEVTSGLDVVDAINEVKTESDRPLTPVVINSIDLK